MPQRPLRLGEFSKQPAPRSRSSPPLREKVKTTPKKPNPPVISAATITSLTLPSLT